MYNLSLYLAGLCLLIGIILQIVSTAESHKKNKTAAQDRLVNDTQQWAMVLLLSAIAFGVLAPHIPKKMADLPSM